MIRVGSRYVWRGVVGVLVGFLVAEVLSTYVFLGVNFVSMATDRIPLGSVLVYRLVGGYCLVVSALLGWFALFLFREFKKAPVKHASKAVDLVVVVLIVLAVGHITVFLIAPRTLDSNMWEYVIAGDIINAFYIIAAGLGLMLVRRLNSPSAIA